MRKAADTEPKQLVTATGASLTDLPSIGLLPSLWPVELDREEIRRRRQGLSLLRSSSRFSAANRRISYRLPGRHPGRTKASTSVRRTQAEPTCRVLTERGDVRVVAGGPTPQSAAGTQAALLPASSDSCPAQAKRMSPSPATDPRRWREPEAHRARHDDCR